MHRLKNFSAPLCALLIAVSGCAHIPADDAALPRKDIARTRLATDIRLAHGGWPEAQWWTAYGDPQLDGLIRQALQDSPTMEAAAARVGSAQAALAENRADEGWSATFNAAANRQRYSGNGLFPPPIGGSYYSEESLQAQAHTSFDWWGRHKAEVAAAVGEVNARRADYAQAEQWLAAEVAQAYFRLQGGWARQAELRRMAESQKALAADKARRIAAGLAAADEQRIAEVELGDIEKQVAQTDAQIVREREALRALLGAGSETLADLKPRPLPDAPHALPPTLGIELLARRPDLQAARWRVEATLSRVEAAQAAFYPHVDLTASFGLDAISLAHLLEAGSRTLFVGPSLSLPLFDSKRLRANLGSARSARDEAIADYNRAVFDAVRDVAQNGAALQGIERQMRQQAAIMQSSAALLKSAREKFEHGLADRAALLSAELADAKQRNANLQLETMQLLAEVSLVKSLGGGYRAGVDATALLQPPKTEVRARP